MHEFNIIEILYQNILWFYLINGGMDNNVLDFLMPLITNFGSLTAWAVLCGLIFIFGGKKGRKIAILGLLALFVSNVAVYYLKVIIAEPRPFIALTNVDKLVTENDIFDSFPSGHTASSFAAAAVIGLRYKIYIKGRSYRLIYPLLAFAAVIGFSRIYIGVHYPLDVIFGALIGILSAFLVLKFEDDIFVNKISNVCLKDITQNKIEK